MDGYKTSILDALTVLSEPTRRRLLRLLDPHEMTVGELCEILVLPQSTVSRHLRVLADGGWVRSRRDGTSRLYRYRPEGLDEGARQLWPLVREEIAATDGAHQDDERLQAILAHRRSRSRDFFASAAGRWQSLRSELFGTRFDLEAALCWLDERWVVGDLGCGTGELSFALSPFVTRVVAVDESPEMLEAAAARLAEAPNAELRPGRLEQLPIDDSELDAAALVLVLHHLPDPGRAVAEAARALKPGGQLVVVDMTPHEREELRAEMGHLWLGFGESAVRGWTEAAGLQGFRFRTLPADPAARGPALFAARATAAQSSPRREIPASERSVALHNS